MPEFWADFSELAVRLAHPPTLHLITLSDEYVLEICEDTWWGQGCQWALDPSILA